MGAKNAGAEKKNKQKTQSRRCVQRRPDAWCDTHAPAPYLRQRRRPRHAHNAGCAPAPAQTPAAAKPPKGGGAAWTRAATAAVKVLERSRMPRGVRGSQWGRRVGSNPAKAGTQRDTHGTMQKWRRASSPIRALCCCVVVRVLCVVVRVLRVERAATRAACPSEKNQPPRKRQAGQSREREGRVRAETTHGRTRTPSAFEGKRT